MAYSIGRGGETGRRAGLKIRWWQHCGGSIPPLGTDPRQSHWCLMSGSGASIFLRAVSLNSNL